jgi:D-alanyl-D-alanine carboxypeptidase
MESRDTREELKRLVSEISLEGNIPGVIVFVERPDDEFLITFGSTRRGGSDTLTGQETLRLGSITKTYMAALALSLVEDGILDLDAPASRYLPTHTLNRLPGGLDPTVRQILGHTSGIPDYYSERFYLHDWERSEPLTPELALHAIRGLEPTITPASSFDYSNTNYHVLALIVEEVTDRDIESLLHQYIFEPLELNETYYDLAHPPGDVLHGYGSPFDPWEPTYEFRENSGPDGGMFATARDVATWIRALFSETGEMHEIGRMMVESPMPDGDRKEQGLGVEILRSRTGRRVYGHTGAIDGYLSAAFFVPSSDAVIVVHATRSNEEAFTAILGGSLRLVMEG